MPAPQTMSEDPPAPRLPLRRAAGAPSTVRPAHCAIAWARLVAPGALHARAAGAEEAA